MGHKTAFVTGATGFVGGHLVHHLLTMGWEVTCLRRQGGAGAEGGARYVPGDIVDFPSLLNAIPEGCGAVFHVAASIKHWRGAIVEQNQVNVGGTRNVARAALARGVGRLVHCSSDAVWGLKTPMLREDVPRLAAIEPGNYHRSKFWAEEEVRCAINAGLDAVMVNPTNVLGPNDRHGWSGFAVSIGRGMTTEAPPGSGGFVHVTDVAKALIAAAQQGRCGHNYLLANVNASYLQFAQACAERIGVSIAAKPESKASVLRKAQAMEAAALVTGKEPPLSIDTARVLCAHLAVDSAKAQTELDFASRALGEVVNDMVDWLRQEGRLAPRQA